jgi:hypothetical protein
VPAGRGGRRKTAASAVVGRVVDIGSGCADDERRTESLLRGDARASAQPCLRKNLPVPVRAATICLFPRGVHLISVSVRACAARPYGEFCNVRHGGDGVGNRGRAVAAGFPRGARKYVVAYCRPLARGPIVVHRCGAFRQPSYKDESYQDHGRPRRTDDGLD